MKLIAVFGALVLLSACATSQPITTPPVTLEVAASNPAPNRIAPTVARTLFVVNNYSAPKELVGVPCSLQGSGLSGEFSTPAIVNIPIYDRSSAPIAVSCTYEGKQVIKAFAIQNESAQQRLSNTRSAGAQYGIVGALLTEAVVAATDRGSDQPGDTYGYGNLIVRFNSEG